jgi:two-component system response regulator FixJ
MIAIVEDDRSLLSALLFALETDGFRVNGFGDAEGLLRAFHHLSADCLVIDQKLPGMDGLSLLAKLRTRGVATPAILITSNPDRNCVEGARAAHAAIVEKPLMNAALTVAIQKAIGGSGLL